MILDNIIDLVEICHQKGIEEVVISPGSRSAALTIAFARHPSIKTYVLADERSAAFVALGIAQMSNRTVALVCTSGTAVANYFPAIIESFFQQIPLLILTADRPNEWINQLDGQTIFQQDIFGKYVKKSYQFPLNSDLLIDRKYGQRIVNEAINLTQSLPKCPVHINVSIREPFYPAIDEKFNFDCTPNIIDRIESKRSLNKSDLIRLIQEWAEANSIMIVVGQIQLTENQIEILIRLLAELCIPIVGDVISNLNFEGAITHGDLFLQNSEGIKKPDLLISIGKSLIAKHSKLFFRQIEVKNHWHFTEIDEIQDPFLNMSVQIKSDPFLFFEEVLYYIDGQHLLEEQEEAKSSQMQLFNNWIHADLKAKRFIRIPNFLDKTWNEFWACREMMEKIPAHSILHLSNSLSVRYANFIGLNPRKKIQVFANRGTSGIDGCLSSAVGNALATDKDVYLLIGDTAFFYDKNGLWHQHIPQNFKIILLNNNGGSIFRMIDGPSKQPELGQYFEVKHNQTAERFALDVGVDYLQSDSFESFATNVNAFFDSKNTIIFEILSNPETNQEVFAEMKKNLQTIDFIN